MVNLLKEIIGMIGIGGVCEEQGENKLGKILMRIREELRYK